MNHVHSMRAFRVLALALLLCFALTSVAFADMSSLLTSAKAKNPDVVAVLEAGPDIALFVPQADNNDYYLTHDVSKADNNSGAAFLDSRCSISPRSQHIMIHGHNMRNGAVFGTLDSYLDNSFIKENPLVYLTTETGVDVYVPYAVSTISVEPGENGFYDMPRFDFATGDALVDFAAGLISRSSVDVPVDVQAGDELLSLVTCEYSYGNGRLVVGLRKLRANETEESMIQLFQANM